MGGDNPDTIIGNTAADEQAIKGLSVYLNSRFWDLSKVEVRVVELRSEKKNQWPLTPGERDDARRPNNRQILGARYFLTDVKATNGKLAACDMLQLDEGRVAVGGISGREIDLMLIPTPGRVGILRSATRMSCFT
ncbi:MAG: hypothetical protein IPL06_17725 [Betaproteobacteria bacterium]|nr:hypothetical protein [Betaproteobacteria bacterium]